MTSPALDQLTALLGCAPPAAYLQLIASYPSRLRTAMRALDDSDAEGTVADVELLRSLDCALALNHEARADALVEPEGTEFLWPEQFMIIGESGAGDYYCLDVAGDIDGVIQYDHQAAQFEVCADSLDEFVEMLLETFVGGDGVGQAD